VISTFASSFVHQSMSGLFSQSKINIPEIYTANPLFDSSPATPTSWMSRDLSTSRTPTSSNADVEGWVSNYIEGRQSTDKEIKNALIDMYNYAGRIVIDAPAKKNFITDDHGKVYCVDVGMALRLINTDVATPDGRVRSKSIESLKIWRDDEAIGAYWSGHKTHKNTINMLKALVYIQTGYPNIFDVNELRDDHESLDELVQAYDLQYDNYWRNEFEDDSSPEVNTTKSDKSSNDENIESKVELPENKTNYKR
jgi:hypothetical protein